MAYYINGKKKNASDRLGRLLKLCISKCDKDWEELVLLCIGSDRITGDSLGPYIGHCMSACLLRNTYIYGTLEKPVHALNLGNTLARIKRRHPRGLVIAIDASLGEKKHLDHITVGNGSICPGAGVRKKLPAAGDIYITGIVCVSGFPEHLSLQNTRLASVVSMADVITKALLSVCTAGYKKPVISWKSHIPTALPCPPGREEA